MGADGLFSSHTSAAFLDEGTADFLPPSTFVPGGNPLNALGTEGAVVDAGLIPFFLKAWLQWDAQDSRS